jgi:beta-lactam-binding protein with PASTA domain
MQFPDIRKNRKCQTLPGPVLVFCCLIFLVQPVLAAAAAPDLKGLTISQAAKVLKKAGMQMVAISVPTLMPSLKGKVFKQEPRAGHRLWDNKQTIKVWYYDTGTQDHSTATSPTDQTAPLPEQDANVRVPSLMGLHQYEAQAKIWSKKLDIAVVKTLPTRDRKLSGSIAFQDPLPQKEVPKGTVISIWVYKYKDSTDEKVKTPLPRMKRPKEADGEKESNSTN